MVKEKLHKKFVCTAGGSCDVASSNRTACKACRYQKCVEIGMALEGDYKKKIFLNDTQKTYITNENDNVIEVRRTSIVNLCE